MIETDRKNSLEAENAMLIELLKMATEVIDVAIAKGYNASPNERRKMHDTLDGVINHGFRDEWLESHDRDMTSTIKAFEIESEKLRETLREFHACSKQIGCERCSYSDRCETLDTINELLEIETDHNLEKTNDYRYSPDEICELIDTAIKRMGRETNSDIRLRYDGVEKVTDVGYAWDGVLFLAEALKREVRARERNGSL